MRDGLFIFCIFWLCICFTYLCKCMLHYFYNYGRIKSKNIFVQLLHRGKHPSCCVIHCRRVACTDYVRTMAIYVYERKLTKYRSKWSPVFITEDCYILLETIVILVMYNAVVLYDEYSWTKGITAQNDDNCYK